MTAGKRTAPRAKRPTAAPLLSFSLEDELERLKNEPEWISGDRNSITLVKTPRLSVVLIALRKGAAMCGHEVDGPITVLVLRGAIRFQAGTRSQVVAKNGFLSLERFIPHDIEALEPSAFLLTIVQPEDSAAERTDAERTVEPGLRAPEPLKLEHEELHAQLAAATQQKGAVGEAAQEVAKLMHPHFVKEEEFALPPLGLLRPLAAGRDVRDTTQAIAMAARLKKELPVMLAEHEQIVAALQKLVEAAKRQNQDDLVRFAERLMLHAQTEEQVMYPAAVLLGEYLRLQANAVESRR